MLSGYAAYAFSNTTDVRASAERLGIGSGAAPYMPRYRAAVDSRLTRTMLRPTAVPATRARSSDRVLSNPEACQTPVGAEAAWSRGIEVPMIAIQAFLSSPRVSTRATAIGPSAVLTASAASSGRGSARRNRRGATSATTSSDIASDRYGQVRYSLIESDSAPPAARHIDHVSGVARTRATGILIATYATTTA